MIDRKEYTLTKKLAQKIFDKFNLGKVTNVKKHFTGINNYIFFVNNYVVRISRRNSFNLDKERLLYRYNLPTPKIIAYDNSLKIIPKPYQITTKIIGKPINFNDNVEEFAELVAKIHSIHFKDLGYFKIGKRLNIQKNKSWENFFFKNFQHNIKILKKHINKELLKEITYFYKTNKELLNIKFHPCLIHHDLSKDNIIVWNNKISGVIDFEWAFSGHNEYELSKIEYQTLKNKANDRFMKIYQRYHKISKDYSKRKVLYRFLNLIMILAGIYEDKEPQKIDKYIDEVKEIIKSSNPTKPKKCKAFLSL